MKAKKLKILPRTHFGNPILREKAKPVRLSFLTNPKFPAFIATMFHTMKRSSGVGLAAPQIGHSIQLAVIQVAPTDLRPKLKAEGKFVVINPRIISHGSKKLKAWEGCLSLPDVRGVVPRYDRIKVRYMNEDGKTVTQEVSGFLARVFQHEVDHLNGLVYVDRMTDMKTLSTEEEYMKQAFEAKK